MARFRKWLFTGLLVIVPGAITLSVLNWIVGLLDRGLPARVHGAVGEIPDN